MLQSHTSSVWFDMRSNARGLRSPFLLAYNQPFSHIDTTGFRVSNVILVIGGKRKRKRLSRCFGVSTRDAELNTVCVRLLKQQSLLLLDCELHLRGELPRILGGPVLGIINASV